MKTTKILSLKFKTNNIKKNILAALIIILMCNPILGQTTFLFTFEQDTNYQKYFYIDSADVNNLWQVGRPNKTVFDSAYNIPNALVTDTANTYTTNNSSSFILWQEVIMPRISIFYYYKINSDTLVDYAKIEGSINGGLSWLDLTAPISSFHKWFTTPVFSGNTSGWELASFEFDVEYLNLHPGDTVLFKFSFISDGIDTYKDGWMIDNLGISHSSGIGINEYIYIQDLFQIVIKGNSEIELIKQNNDDVSNCVFKIFDILGKPLFSFKIENRENNIFQLNNTNTGVYLYSIIRENMMIQNGKFLLIK